MKLLARTVAHPAAVRDRLPAATVSDDGVLELAVPPAEWTSRCLEVANAVDELEGRPVLTYDEASTAVDIAAPTDEVFESLTDSELFERWFGLPYEIELFAGGAGPSAAAARRAPWSTWSPTTCSSWRRTRARRRGGCPSWTPAPACR